MDIAQLRAELEADQSWRLDEIRRLQNLAEQIPNKSDQDQFRRSLVLLLYAHFEGYCKFALTVYVNSINAAKIKCGEANFAIVAASFDGIFQQLRDPDKKSDVFRKSLPDDKKLHRFAREREFLEKTADFAERSVQIDERYIDTESNLTPIVLRKNLYKLGFPYNLFEPHEDKLNMLIEYRNGIAHGRTKEGMSFAKYEKIRNSAIEVMEEMTRQITRAMREKWYLRNQSPLV